MGKEIIRDVFISVNGVDLSEHCSQIEVDLAAAEVDVTGMGAANTETLLGIGSGDISATFFQDTAAGSVHATLSALQGSNTPFEVIVRMRASDPVSVTNPNYVGQMILPEYKPISGAVNSASTTDAAFKNASNAGIVQETS